MSSTVESLKELGNTAFRRQHYREAIRLYTEALESVGSNVSIPIETQRILLANRAQAFVLAGVIYEALRDLNHALSPQYTTQDSPKALTAKYQYRRAKVLCTFARYDEAQADYREFANIMGEIGKEVSDEELKLKVDIDRKAAAGADSVQRRKDDLMRAVDARGFILAQNYRTTFPFPPPDILERLGPDFDPESMTVSFDTPNSKPDPKLPDPTLTPILLPVTIGAPFFHTNPNDPTPFSTREETLIPENDTIGAVIQGVFTSMAAFYAKGGNREIISSAVEHERDGVVVMLSARKRLFKIPRKTKIKDVIAGARWPRQPNAPTFEDLRRTPREREDEIDGIELTKGWMIGLHVVAKDKLEAFIDGAEMEFSR